MRELTGPVYVVCSEVPPDVVGGLGRYAERLISALREAGTRVEVFGTVRRGGAPRTERLGDVVLHRLPMPGIAHDEGSRVRHLARTAGLVVFNLRVAARIRRARARRAGAVVAVHDWMGCLAGIICALSGLPVVFHVHTRELNAAPGSRRSLRAALLDRLETVQARLARLIVVPSADVRDELAARGWPAGRLRVVPHGFEEPELLRLARLPRAERDRLRDETRRRYLPGGGRLVVFAGRLSPHKGVGTLIRAVPRIVRAYGDAVVLIIGAQLPRSGDDAVVARLIEETGVRGHVVAGYRFLPSADVFAHFLAADVCVFPSTYEPFGLVAVEAMALARPVVVGPGYAADVVGDGAVRCARDSPDELADAVLSLLDAPGDAARLGERGAAHVRARLSWDTTAKRTLELYAEAAGR